MRAPGIMPQADADAAQACFHCLQRIVGSRSDDGVMTLGPCACEDEHVAGTGLDVRHFRFQRIELGFDRIVGVAVLHETVHVGSPAIGAERGPFEVELP